MVLQVLQPPGWCQSTSDSLTVCRLTDTAEFFLITSGIFATSLLISQEFAVPSGEVGNSTGDGGGGGRGRGGSPWSLDHTTSVTLTVQEHTGALWVK